MFETTGIIAVGCLQPPATVSMEFPLKGEGRIAEGDPGRGPADSPRDKRRRFCDADSQRDPRPARSSEPTSPFQGEVQMGMPWRFRGTMPLVRRHLNCAAIHAISPLARLAKVVNEKCAEPTGRLWTQKSTAMAGAPM